MKLNRKIKFIFLLFKQPGEDSYTLNPEIIVNRFAFIFILTLYTAMSNASIELIKEDAKYILLDVTEQSVQGENNTLTSARLMNLEKAKKSAADFAGSYTETTTVVTGNELTKEQVRTLTAAFIEVVSSKDTPSVNESGSVVLTTNATIRLSKKAIAEGLKKLKNDPARQRKMAALEKDNQKLRSQLLVLTRKIDSGKFRTDLMAQRDEILKSLDKNREASRQVFERGTLFQLAQLDEGEFENAKRDIEQNIFGYFKHEINIETGKPRFIRNDDGTYNLHVPVSWNLSKEPAQDTLKKYFEIEADRYSYKESSTDLLLLKRNNTKYNHRIPHRAKLFNHLYDRYIVIKIDTGTGKKGYLPIGGYGERRRGSSRTSGYVLQFASEHYLISRRYRNPVVIRNLTKSQLNKIVTLSTSIEIKTDKSLRGWKYE